MADNKLSIGISEDQEFSWPSIPSANFSEGGRYRDAFLELEKLLSKPLTEKVHQEYWRRCLESGSTLPAATYEQARNKARSDIRWILVVESESARIWRDGPMDYRTALREYQRSAQTDSNRIKAAISELRRFDEKHPYLLRHTMQRAMQDFLSDEETRHVKRPNPNTEQGFERLTVSGPAVREHEFQFLSKMSFFKFDRLLDSWSREVDAIFLPWPANWMEFGALRFEEAIAPKAAAKMNIVQLSLIAHLVSRLRDFTEGYGICSYGTGQPIPKHGRPCWSVVAEFVNCALELENPLTAESVRRVWQSFASKHDVRMQSWPRPPKRELQASKR